MNRYVAQHLLNSYLNSTFSIPITTANHKTFDARNINHLATKFQKQELQPCTAIYQYDLVVKTRRYFCKRLSTAYRGRRSDFDCFYTQDAYTIVELAGFTQVTQQDAKAGQDIGYCQKHIEMSKSRMNPFHGVPIVQLEALKQLNEATEEAPTSSANIRLISTLGLLVVPFLIL